MANLVISVGPVTSTRTASNTKAAEVLNLVVVAIGGPIAGTDQEKLDSVTAYLTQHLREVARGHNSRQILAQAHTDANTANNNIDWSDS
jgi:hypothetical protein